MNLGLIITAAVVLAAVVSLVLWRQPVFGFAGRTATYLREVRAELTKVTWPTWDEQHAADDELKIGVTVNGKPRGELVIPVEMQDDEEGVKRLALELPRVKAIVDGQTVRRVIYRPGKLLNLVVS